MNRVRTWIRRLARERGLSYSLPFVLTIPIFLTFMVLAVEVAFLLQAKLGTMNAAFAAARAAIVWQSAQPAEIRESRINQAARTALAPFVGGRQHEIDVAGPLPHDADSQAADFAIAARHYIGSSAPDASFLARKYRNAAARTKVKVNSPAGPRSIIRVTVQFRAPLYLPVASRFLDPDGSSPFEYSLSAVVELPNDAPISADGTIGIAYSSDLTARK